MKIFSVLSFLIVLFLSSCDNHRYKLDLSNIESDVRFERLDSVLANIDLNSNINQKMIEIYGENYAYYFSNILNEGSVYSANADFYIKNFLNDPSITEANEEIKKKFSNISELKNKLNNALKYYQHYFPKDKKLTSINFINSGFNAAVYAFDSLGYIGLDMYLGADNQLVKRFGETFPQYLRTKMNPDFLVPDFMLNLIALNHFPDPKNETLLSYLISYGKVMYALDLICPEVESYNKMRYTEEEYQTAVSKEYFTWELIIKNEHLYSKDSKMINSWFSEGPFTAALSQESPDRMGFYVGWKMVEAYMKDNPDTSLDDLFKKVTEKEILKEYKPKR